MFVTVMTVSTCKVMFDVKENVTHSQLQSTENFHCPLPRHKADALKRSLQVYRESLLSGHTPLFGIEIATGISDNLITNIVCNPLKYSVDVIPTSIQLM